MRKFEAGFCLAALVESYDEGASREWREEQFVFVLLERLGRQMSTLLDLSQPNPPSKTLDVQVAWSRAAPDLPRPTAAKVMSITAVPD